MTVHPCKGQRDTSVNLVNSKIGYSNCAPIQRTKWCVRAHIHPLEMVKGMCTHTEDMWHVRASSQPKS